MPAPRIVVLAGGVGGAKFVRGLRQHCRTAWPDGQGGTTAEITVVVNTGDDLWLAGLRVTPDLDSLLYALAGVNDTVRGWGRAGESERVSARAHRLRRRLAVVHPRRPRPRHPHRPHRAAARGAAAVRGRRAALRALAARGARSLPATDDEVETHVASTRTASGELHFEEWWVRTRAALPAERFVQAGVETAQPAPGVVAAILPRRTSCCSRRRTRWSRSARSSASRASGRRCSRRPRRSSGSPPIIGGAVGARHGGRLPERDRRRDERGRGRRGTTAHAPRAACSTAGSSTRSDAGVVAQLTADGIPSRAVPLWMHDDTASAAIAAEALALANP